MNKIKLNRLSGIALAILCLTMIPLASQAAPSKGKAKAKAAQQVQKERLVLMPLRLEGEDQKLQGTMESALVDGLQQKYTVLWGEEVEKKAQEIFRKENLKHECNEERCMQGIAEAFQSELLATVIITKQAGGYFLTLTIQNLYDHLVVFTRPLQCKGCDSFQVVDKLKELGIAAAPVAAPSIPVAVAPADEAPPAKVNLSDAETALWEEAKKGNAAEDYQAYLSTYPKGKYAPLAKTKLIRLKDEARAAQVQEDQQAWNTAQQGGNQDSYAAYLSLYPQGQYAALAQGRIDKIKREASAAEAKQKREAAEAAARTPQPGKVIKDCADCPEMVIVPAGSFNMGETNAAHSVTIAKAFALGKTEITQGQWKAVMGNNPSNFQNCGDNCPVEKVNWDEAKEFIQKLNAKTGKQYRLPSEAEWEYACRAGQQTEYCGGDNLDSVAWYGAYANPVGNSAKTTNPVATKQANAWGLYDMSGNVWEWVEDNYHANYNGAPTDGSVWQGGDSAKRVLRGGSWYFNPDLSRAANRIFIVPAFRSYIIGFRVARTLP